MGDGKILIVDDNPTGRELLRDTIELEGDYEIVTAANGVEALEVAGQEMPNLILMDLHMPLMDGYETTERLKTNPATSHIPVVALTASHVMSDDHKRAIQVGCADYLQKPVARVILLQKVRQHIRL
ncbi:MAG: response regulator [Chloroflexota bacterium]|nr:response regulator [Chloroflexota bacterium]